MGAGRGGGSDQTQALRLFAFGITPGPQIINLQCSAPLRLGFKHRKTRGWGNIKEKKYIVFSHKGPDRTFDGSNMKLFNRH